PARLPTPDLGAAETWRQRQLRQVVDINGLIQDIMFLMEAAGYSDKDQFAVRLSLEEAMVNAVKHRSGEDTGKKVTVSYQVTVEHLVTRIEDEGPGFNPNRIPDPLAPENLERPGGRGVFLMRHYMTTVHFNERGNCVTLAKKKTK